MKTYVFVELDGLVHLPGETIDQESTFTVLPSLALATFLQGSTHCVLKQFDSDLHGHNLTLLDICTNHFAMFRAGAILLSPKKIASYRYASAVKQ